MSGKKNDYEGIVILPMVKSEDIKNALKKVIGKVESKADLKRNILGKTFVYVFNEDESFTFESYYGNIDECKVKVELFDL